MTTLRRTIAAAVLVGLTVVAGVLALGAYRHNAATAARGPAPATAVRPVRRTVPVATVPVARSVLSGNHAALATAGGATAGKLAPNDAAALASVLARGDAALGCVPDPHPPVLPTPKATDPLVCYATGPGGSVTVVIAMVGKSAVAVVVPSAAPSLPSGATVEAPS